MVAIDFSTARFTVAQLQGAGVTAVGRYVGDTSNPKNITQSEFDEYANAGIGVWLVFEDETDDFSGGASAGEANARIAFNNIPHGYPDKAPIYFAVDTEVSGSDLTTAVAYIQGASTVITPALTGDYGEGALCQATHDAGVASFHWQSASTSFPGNATTLPITNIQQGLGGPLPGTDLDTLITPITTPSPPGGGGSGSVGGWHVGGIAWGTSTNGGGTPTPPSGGNIPNPASGKWCCQYLEQLWIAGGGSSAEAPIMAGIAEYESGGDPTATNPSGATGLWQVEYPDSAGGASKATLLTPIGNAIAAVKLFKADVAAGRDGTTAWTGDPVWQKWVSSGRAHWPDHAQVQTWIGEIDMPNWPCT